MVEIFYINAWKKGNIVFEKGKIELIDVNPFFVWRLKKSLRGGGNFSNFIFDFFFCWFLAAGGLGLFFNSFLSEVFSG